jgi:hypothetical protein
MKPFEYYTTPTTPLPNKRNYTKYYVYDKGRCLRWYWQCQCTKSELIKRYPNAVIQETIEDAYNKRRKQYNSERANLHGEFVKDLFEEFGVCNNPKSMRCFELAWEYGHSAGYEEVYNYFVDLVELIK